MSLPENTLLSGKIPGHHCSYCDYTTNNKKDYNKHLSTRKHIRIQEEYNEIQKCPKGYHCSNCDKTYKYHSGLWKHKQTCTANIPLSHDEDLDDVSSKPVPPPPPQMVDLSLVMELLKQNQEFKELLVEQYKQLAEQCNINQQQNTQLLEAVKDGKLANNNNINTNCNNTNNKFNLNFFLNETCKDAITLDDFVKSFQVTRDDFIHTGNVGFIEGISTVIMNRFRDMDMHTRPLHCTDLKRETVYIKNADKWEKEDNHKTNLRKAVKGVANKNMKELWRWYNDNKPEVELIGTDECENYFKYYKAALGGCGKEEDLKFEDKIIKNVLKEVQIDKSTMTIQ